MAIEITVSRRRPDGSLAKVVLDAVIREATTESLEETASLLLKAEMAANKDMDVRVHISGEFGIPR